MINTDDYISPVKIKYNKKLLNDYVSSIETWPSYSIKGGKYFSEFKDILFPINLEAWRIKAFLKESSTYSFSYVPPGAETGYHSDYTRGCTLILPIDNKEHLIRFKKNDIEIDYYYDGPVITNAKTIHNGINHTDEGRFNLLFHFDKSYNEMKQLNDEGTLALPWIQVYPIKNNTNNKCIDDYFNPSGDGLEINYIEGGISVGDKKIYYNKANDYDVCLAIKYILENDNCSQIKLI
jgi:hypothetical protein